MKDKFLFISVVVVLLHFGNIAQNETRNWAFGNYAGLNFSTNPPTVTSFSPFSSSEGISCISDANGNYLFGSNGTVIRNQLNAIMANGSGVIGDPSASQGVLIVKQPNSNLYYVFTVPGISGSGIYYSIVDMSLASGMGSVTVKNSTLMANFQSAEMIAGIKHCNGVDTWIVTHPVTPGKFYSFLLTSGGLNTTPVVSSVGYDTIAGRGYIKFSPDGKKIALPIETTTVNNQGGIVIHDFDRAAGIVSTNSITIAGAPLPYGIEFSSDGSKIYSSDLTPTYPPFQIYQWNLCAGNSSAINASKSLIFTDQNTQIGALQRANNGKIYVTRSSKDTLGVIHNPNNLGTTCSYSHSGQPIAPRYSTWGFPNFVHGSLIPSVAPFTFTGNCQNYNFQADGSSPLCGTLYSAITSVQWNFGDPNSGQNNLSTLLNPSHFFSAPGTYTVKALLTRQCTVDTLIQTINVVGLSPTFTITAKSGICVGQSATLSASGSYSYQWSNGANTSSISVSPTVNTIYTSTATNALGCTITQSVQVSVNKCNGVASYGPAVNVSIYPNPNSNGHCSINSDEAIIKIQVFDGQGVLILAETGFKITEIDIRPLQNGFYFVRLESEKHVFSSKLVIE